MGGDHRPLVIQPGIGPRVQAGQPAPAPLLTAWPENRQAGGLLCDLPGEQSPSGGDESMDLKIKS